VTGDPSDVVQQSDILAVMRAPSTGWEFSWGHDAGRLVRFLKGWCDAEGVRCGEGDAESADARLRRAHCKGIVFKKKPAESSVVSEADAAAAAVERAKAREAHGSQTCVNCNSVDLLSRGLCGACDPLVRIAVRRVRSLFREVGLNCDFLREVLDGGFRPDFVFNPPTHFVVVEVDDNQHKGYSAEAERARMVAIGRRLGKPTVFVRYNPDDYEPGSDAVVSRRDGDPRPAPETEAVREKTLVYWVQRLVWTPRSAGGIEVLHLFYDGFVPGREKVERV
jgi:hypothetical protein